MSNRLMQLCRPLRMPPPAKAVLMSLADRANDQGEAWPSIATLVDDTCFGRTAVIGAVKWLEDNHVLRADRSNGRHSAYVLTPDTYQSATRTSSPDAPVRHANTTGSPAGPDQSATRTAPVRQADTNHKEPKGTHKSNPNVGASRFDEFWAAYPKKVGDKPRAEKHWLTKRLDTKADVIIAAVRARVASDPSWRDPRFIPHPTTYLNGERWNDEWQPHASSARPLATDPIEHKQFEGHNEGLLLRNAA